ncbi:MAG: hypothetical protein AAFV53_34180 [Myxococcota bacterium]
MRRIQWMLLALILPAYADEPPPAENPPPATEPFDLGGEPSPPATAETPKPEAKVLLDRATAMLASGDFGGALDIAIPAISDYPRQAASFRAIAEIATDQIFRVQAPTWVPSSTHDNPKEFEARKSQVRLGFDMGLPSAVRVDFQRSRGSIDSMGFMLGSNISASTLGPITQFAYYIDWRINSKVQFTMPVGLFFYNNSTYPLVGVGLQYDPPGPFHVDMGIATGGVPTLSTGFLW